MILFRRRAEPSRKPHPDPAVELELQRIITLRKRVSEKQEMIREGREEIGLLHDEIRRLASKSADTYAGYSAKWCDHQIDKHEARVVRISSEIRELDADIDKTQDAIAELQTRLGPIDLAYL